MASIYVVYGQISDVESVPDTNIILGADGFYSNLGLINNQDSSCLEDDVWIQFYLDLVNATGPEVIPNFDMWYIDKAREANNSNTYHIVMMDYDYKEIIDSSSLPTINEEFNGEGDDTNIGQNSYLVEHNSQLLGLITPARPDKDVRRFVFRSDNFFSNYTEFQPTYEISFGDGNGYVPLEFDHYYDIEIGLCNSQIIQLRKYNEIEDCYDKVSCIELDRCENVYNALPPITPPVVPNISPLPDPNVGPYPSNTCITSDPNFTNNFTASIPFEGCDDELFCQSPYSLGPLGKIEVAYYINPERDYIKRPIIITDGIDLSGERGLIDILNEFGGNNALAQFFSGGYDVIIVNFIGGADYIQRNAFALISLIESLNTDPQVESIPAVIGPSMGGLVCKYALRYMENQGADHEVDVLVTFDSPHRGSNISVGLQAAALAHTNKDKELKKATISLHSPAAAQMLLYHVNIYNTSTPSFGDIVYNPDILQAHFSREDYLMDIANNGEFPTQCKVIAIANGSKNGTSSNSPPGEKFLSAYSFVWKLGFRIRVNLAFRTVSVFGFIKKIFESNWLKDARSNSHCDNIDSAPGSSYDLERVQIKNSTVHGRFCFIPSTSALAIDGTDYFVNIEDEFLEDYDSQFPHLGYKIEGSPFDAVYIDDGDSDHVAVDMDILGFIQGHIDYNIQTVDYCNFPIKLEGDDVIYGSAQLLLKDGIYHSFNLITDPIGNYCVADIPVADYNWSLNTSISGTHQLLIEDIFFTNNRNNATVEVNYKDPNQYFEGFHLLNIPATVCVNVDRCETTLPLCKDVLIKLSLEVIDLNNPQFGCNRTGEHNDQTENRNFNEDSKISVYPTPTSDMFNIKTYDNNISEYVIVNPLGAEVYREQILSPIMTVNVSEWHKGIYFIQFVNKDQEVVEVKKLLVH